MGNPDSDKTFLASVTLVPEKLPKNTSNLFINCITTNQIKINIYHKIIELIDKNNKRIKLIKKEIKYLPSSLTTSGILSPKFCDAAIIPFAIVTQFTIPPKTLTRITLTFGSDKKKRN